MLPCNNCYFTIAQRNIKVAIAAGNNNGGSACAYSPASAPSALAVGASTSTDALATFSNVGPCLFIFAPGAYIVSAWPTSNTDEATMSGTSMATPHVSYGQWYIHVAHITCIALGISHSSDPISYNPHT